MIPQLREPLRTFYAGAPTARDNFTGINWDQNAVQLQPIPASSLVTVACTFLPSHDVYLGYAILLQIALNGASGEGVGISNVSLQSTPAVSLGLNNVPPLVERPPINYSLAFCQRYYEALTTSAPYLLGTSQHSNVAPSSSVFEYDWVFKTQKRAPPSIGVVGGFQVTTPNIFPSIDMAVFQTNNGGEFLINANDVGVSVPLIASARTTGDSR